MDTNDPASQLEEYKQWYKDKVKENRELKREIRQQKREIRELKKENQQLNDEIPTYMYEGNDGEYMYFDNRTGEAMTRSLTTGKIKKS